MRQITTAYMHDRIVFEGGAEEVLRMLIRKYGSADAAVFVLYSPHRFFQLDGQQLPIYTALPARINRFLAAGSRSSIARIRGVCDYRNLLLVYPLLCRLLRKKIRSVQPQKAIISSFAAVKNVVSPTNKRPLAASMTLYLHSPMQYIRENYTEYSQKITGLKGILFKRVVPYLRKRDKKHRTYSIVYANSAYTARCARSYYNLEATVRYPQLAEACLRTVVAEEPREYFVYVGRLVRFIREVDRIIELCNVLRLSLLVIGSGPDEAFLQQMAGPTIIFLGQVNNVDEKLEIIRHAKGFINISKESCGIATMEALALGVPVFGYAAGGTQELVGPNSGILVTDKNLATLQQGMEKFLATTRNRKQIQESFREFYLSNTIS